MDDTETNTYNFYKAEATKYGKMGQLDKCLDFLLKMNTLRPTAKNQQRISSVMTAIEDEKNENELMIKDEKEEKMDTNNLTIDNAEKLVKPTIYSKLYKHQRVGVEFFLRLFKRKGGAVLGDDMGLGKTIQTIAFLSGLFHYKLINNAIIVAPLSVLSNWEKEWEKWDRKINLFMYHGSNKAEKERTLKSIQSVKGAIMLTTYGTIQSSHELISTNYFTRRTFCYDYIVLDEAHAIKNPSSKTAKALFNIKSTYKIALTGTPIQNNLMEMWSLFNWTHSGTLLGNQKTFKEHYENPIKYGREKDTKDYIKARGEDRAHALFKKIEPFYLHRSKSEVTESEKSRKSGEHINLPRMPQLSKKTDFIVWCYLSQTQKEVYNNYFESPEIQALLNTKKSPLVACTVFKKICDHPLLLTSRQIIELGIIEEDKHFKNHISDGMLDKAPRKDIIKILPLSIIKSMCGKLNSLMPLMSLLTDEGHKVLLFSLSKVTLDILERCFTDVGIKFVRLDGTITGPNRKDVIERFIRSKPGTVFLLTTKVGGLGLTLTAADRVVIFDPWWNPAVDSQAVDRAFRIGQDKDVIIYRLMTCGTIEEKIYRRQIFKTGVSEQVTEQKLNSKRYFSSIDIRSILILENTDVSNTHAMLEVIHGPLDLSQVNGLKDHVDYLLKLPIFGLTDHQRVFEHRDDDIELNDDEKRGLQSESVNLERQLQKDITESSRLNVSGSGASLFNYTTNNMGNGYDSDKYSRYDKYSKDNNYDDDLFEKLNNSKKRYSDSDATTSDESDNDCDDSTEMKIEKPVLKNRISEDSDDYIEEIPINLSQSLKTSLVVKSDSNNSSVNSDSSSDKKYFPNKEEIVTISPIENKLSRSNSNNYSLSPIKKSKMHVDQDNYASVEDSMEISANNIDNLSSNSLIINDSMEEEHDRLLNITNSNNTRHSISSVSDNVVITDDKNNLSESRELFDSENEETGESESEAEFKRYQDLITTSKLEKKKNNYEAALNFAKEAFNICSENESLNKYIDKLKSAILKGK